MSNTPSDAEIKKLAEECGIGWAAGLGGMDDFLRAFARAVLAKWGTPQPAPAPLSESDERKAFEQDFMRALSGENLKRKFGHYEDPRTRHRWDGWKARAALSANAGEPVAIRPDIQAVLAMLDVPVIARMSSHEGKLLKPGQEPPAFESAVPLVREWDHRRACESIIAALTRNN